MEFKQCIIVREDLKLSSGKLAVQVAHAAVLAMERADKRIVRDWKEEGQRKIVLKARTLQDVFRLRDEAERAGVAAAIVIDAGLTEIPPGTVTALGLGPAPEAQIDRITGGLKLV
jgi:PTH2 family peptidyl-tRNA hydrolase